MKPILFSVLLLLGASPVVAQLPVPSAVERAFAQSHDYISQPFWEMREGAYVAMFSDEEGLKKVFFETDGTWRETRTRIQEDELPAGVISFIRQHYKAADKTYIGKVESTDGIRYRVESELQDAVVIKLLNAAGELQEEQRIALNNLPRSVIIAHPMQAPGKE